MYVDSIIRSSSSSSNSGSPLSKGPNLFVGAGRFAGAMRQDEELYR